MWNEYGWVILFCIGFFIFLYLLLNKIVTQKLIKKKLSISDKNEKHMYKAGFLNLFDIRFKKKLLNLIPVNSKKNLENIIRLCNTKYTLEDILVFKVFAALFMFSASLFLMQSFISYLSKIVIIIILVLAGYKSPDFFLKRKAKKRRKSIKHSLPAFIDYLIICVESGMGLDMAIYNVAIKMNNTLSEEVLKAINEMNYGRSRKEVLKNLSDRLDLPEATSFFNAIISSELLGISLGQILRVQGEEMREKRKQQIREKAYKIPIKLMFPLVFFILPALFVVVLGPALIQLFKTFFN